VALTSTKELVVTKVRRVVRQWHPPFHTVPPTGSIHTSRGVSPETGGGVMASAGGGSAFPREAGVTGAAELVSTEKNIKAGCNFTRTPMTSRVQRHQKSQTSRPPEGLSSTVQVGIQLYSVPGIQPALTDTLFHPPVTLRVNLTPFNV